jgi:hypothetical protein
VTAVVSAVDTRRLLAALSQGLESTITFELRLYRRTTGLRALLGDRLLAQRSVGRRASMDLIDGRYILLDEGGETRAFAAPEDFVRDFVALRALPLGWRAEPGSYLAARARVEYVRLEPPLHIVALFRPNAVVTDWSRVDLAAPGEPAQ